MYYLVQSNDVQDSFTAFITPYLPLIITIIGGLIVGGFGIWNRRHGNIETRAPDVNEIWQQQAAEAKELDLERRLRRRLEDLLRELVRVFWLYTGRVQGGGSKELNTQEHKAITAAEKQINGE